MQGAQRSQGVLMGGARATSRLRELKTPRAWRAAQVLGLPDAIVCGERGKMAMTNQRYLEGASCAGSWPTDGPPAGTCAPQQMLAAASVARADSRARAGRPFA
jgi:hypothetical protein